jgi:beta-lactamase regulating signal transducer with metallopeptidase domain
MSVEMLFDAAAKGALVLMIAAMATSSMRRSSAARRHLVWAAAVSALLLIPLLSFVMPAWGVLPTASLKSEAPSAARPVDEMNAGAMEVGTPVPTVKSSMDEAAPPPASIPVETPRSEAGHMSATTVLLLAWVMGAMVALIAIATGFVRVALLSLRARPLERGQCRDAVAAMAAAEGLNVELLEGSADAMPMTWGVLRPKLLLPAAAHHWHSARLRAVVRHELAHIQRRDAMWQLVADVACALHWFNPLAWYAARQMRVEREHACDDAVLVSGSRASEYAAELLEIARSMRAARATSLAAIAMARPRQLEGRLLAVLDDRRERSEVVRRWPFWVVAACVLLPIAAMQPAVAEGTSGAAANEPVVSAAAPESEPAPIAKAAVLDAVFNSVEPQQAACARQPIKNLSMSTQRNDDFTRVKWETRNCKGTLEYNGNVRIAGDLSGFASIPAGSKVEIDARDENHRRELTLTPGSNGGFAYVYKVDGDRRTWDNEGKAWLSSILTLLVRRGGFGAEERVEYLLSRNGVQGVLDEVALIDSDYTQRTYLNYLLRKSTLNSGAVRSVLSLAQRELDSDYELTEFLIAVASRYDFNDESRAAFIRATSTLDSDYEHRRALSAVLKKGGLNTDDVTAVLVSAGDIDSDYEKAELLISVAGKYGFDQRMRTAYLNATRGMNSDYEKSRVLRTLLKQRGLTASDLADVIDATTAVRSDYERSQILQTVSASIDLSQPQLQQAYVKAASEIDSDHELRQVLSVLLKRDRLSPAAIDVALDAAGTINSDYERSEVLLQLLRTHTLTQAQRARVIKMAESMGSSHERGRVSSMLLRQLNN